MIDSKACDVALFTFSLNSASCNGGSSARRRLRYEQKLELPINRKSTSDVTLTLLHDCEHRNKTAAIPSIAHYEYCMVRIVFGVKDVKFINEITAATLRGQSLL